MPTSCLIYIYLYLPLREIGVRRANHESACHSSRAARRPRLSLQRQNPNSSSLLRLQDGTEVVRLPEGSLTKPQEDEVGGVRIRNIPDFCSPPLYGCRSHLSRPPISAQSLPPIGGKLSAFSAEWTKIRASQWVLRTILEGYSLPFSSLPPLTSPVFLASYQNPEKRRALHDAVKEMEMKGAIEVVRTPSPGFYSWLFLVPKARGTWRPIIDLSVLNTHIQCPSFKMETNGSLLKALQKGQWLNSPLLQAVPPVLPRGRGLAIPNSSFWVKHCTTSVYSGHGICRGLRPSQWGQPPRLSR